jgi:hypothetical protein
MEKRGFGGAWEKATQAEPNTAKQSMGSKFDKAASDTAQSDPHEEKPSPKPK